LPFPTKILSFSLLCSSPFFGAPPVGIEFTSKGLPWSLLFFSPNDQSSRQYYQFCQGGEYLHSTAFPGLPPFRLANRTFDPSRGPAPPPPEVLSLSGKYQTIVSPTQTRTPQACFLPGFTTSPIVCEANCFLTRPFTLLLFVLLPPFLSPPTPFSTLT